MGAADFVRSLHSYGYLAAGTFRSITKGGESMLGMHRNRINEKESVKKLERFRLFVQVLATALINGYAIGFAKGKIFTGPTKISCVPVLNCYSCPGALGSCPIGALQAVLGGAKHNFSFYVIGLIMLFGTVLGRLICGFLCPFGLVQDLLYKIPTKKIKVPAKADKPARYIKYVIAVVMVILLPIFATNKYGIAPPYFCKFLCPAGTLGGGIPLLITNESLRRTIGFLFGWKFMLLISILVLSIFISRFFCKYFCPLGAFYSLFNKFSFYQMHLEPTKCIDCKQCERACPMQVEVTKNINHPECIRCGKCKAVCPTHAIISGFTAKACLKKQESNALQHKKGA